MKATDLPGNVRRWLERSLPDGAPAPAKITNTQRGAINIRDSWTPFTATTTYQADPFSFEWQARIRPMPLLWLQARDYHAGSTGGGGTRLFGLLSMGGREDPTAYRMQLTRSLAELPWAPPLALLVPGLQWEDNENAGFSLHASINGQEIDLNFDQNEAGEVVRVSGQRHFDTPDGYTLAPWQITYADHQEMGGMHLPGSAAAVYEKPDGRWEYWRATLDTLRLLY